MLTQRQEKFLRLTNLEALYRGSDESITLLFGALQYVDCPGYNALILAPTYPALALPRALVDIAAQILKDTDANSVDGGWSWRFPSGANLHFGYLESARDKYRYVGIAWQYIGWDNIMQFPHQTDYKFLFGFLRKLKTAQHVPLRVRSGVRL